MIEFVLIPILIFLARVCDVTIGTIRIILLSKGHKILAPLLGFIEVIIWLAAIGQVMQNLSNPISYIAYGGGFAFGNFVGIWLEKKLALGLQAIRVITTNMLQSLGMILLDEGYAVTFVEAKGSKGPVNIIYTVVKRKEVEHIMEIIRMFEPTAFVTVEDIRTTYAGYFKPERPFRLMKKK